MESKFEKATSDELSRRMLDISNRVAVHIADNFAKKNDEIPELSKRLQNTDAPGDQLSCLESFNDFVKDMEEKADELKKLLTNEKKKFLQMSLRFQDSDTTETVEEILDKRQKEEVQANRKCNAEDLDTSKEPTSLESTIETTDEIASESIRTEASEKSKNTESSFLSGPLSLESQLAEGSPRCHSTPCRPNTSDHDQSDRSAQSPCTDVSSQDNQLSLESSVAPYTEVGGQLSLESVVAASAARQQIVRAVPEASGQSNPQSVTKGDDNCALCPSTEQTPSVDSYTGTDSRSESSHKGERKPNKGMMKRFGLFKSSPRLKENKH